MRKTFVAAALALSVVQAQAQIPGNFPAGSVYGNSSAAGRPGRPETATAILDRAFAAVQGNILYRNASAWVVLAPGTDGQQLRTGGAGANPSWSTATWPNTAAAGTVVSALTSNTFTASAAPVLGIAGTTLGSMGFSGNTSGVVTVRGAAAAGTYNYVLPTTAGTAGQALLSGGGGTTAMTYTTGVLALAGNFTTSGANALTLTTTGTTNSTLPLGTQTLAALGLAQTWSANQTYGSGNLIGPNHIGGTGTGSSLSLQSTSGVGATDFVDILVGNNGATRALRATNAGRIGIGNTVATTDLAIGDDLGTAFGAASTLSIAAAAGGRAGNSYIILGQSSSRNLNFGWQYNATAANAIATIGTFGSSNPLQLGGSYISISNPLAFGGSTPTLSSCGTSPSIVGNQTEGTVTMGTGTPSGCTITFVSAYTSAVRCSVTWRANIAAYTYTNSLSAITITQTATSSNLVDYRCFGN